MEEAQREPAEDKVKATELHYGRLPLFIIYDGRKAWYIHRRLIIQPTSECGGRNKVQPTADAEEAFGVLAEFDSRLGIVCDGED